MAISNRQADFTWFWSNVNPSIPDVIVTPIPAVFANEGGALTGASVAAGNGYQTVLPASLSGRIAIAGASVRSNVSWASGSTIRVQVSGIGILPTSVEALKVTNFMS